jgi:hypothetical protein
MDSGSKRCEGIGPWRNGSRGLERLGRGQLSQAEWIGLDRQAVGGALGRGGKKLPPDEDEKREDPLAQGDEDRRGPEGGGDEVLHSSPTRGGLEDWFVANTAVDLGNPGFACPRSKCFIDGHVRVVNELGKCDDVAVVDDATVGTREKIGTHDWRSVDVSSLDRTMVRDTH